MGLVNFLMSLPSAIIKAVFCGKCVSQALFLTGTAFVLAQLQSFNLPIVNAIEIPFKGVDGYGVDLYALFMLAFHLYVYLIFWEAVMEVYHLLGASF